jgi:hypothetical protein
MRGERNPRFRTEGFMKRMRAAFAVGAGVGTTCLVLACSDHEASSALRRAVSAMTATTVGECPTDVPPPDFGPCGLNGVLEGTDCCTYSVVEGALTKSCTPQDGDAGTPDTAPPDPDPADTAPIDSAPAPTDTGVSTPTDTGALTPDTATAPIDTGMSTFFGFEPTY